MPQQPPTARRAGDDVLVSDLHPDLLGWTVTVHALGTGGITITPPAGARITEPAVRLIRIGAVLDAAAALTAEDRLAAAAASVNGWTGPDWAPGHHRDVLVREAYRAALRHGIAPRALIAHLWNITEYKAGTWLTEMRSRQAIGSVQTERQGLGL